MGGGLRRDLGKRVKTPRALACLVLSWPGPHPRWPGSSKKDLTVSKGVSRSSPDRHLLWILVPFPDAMRSPPPSLSYKHSGTEWNGMRWASTTMAACLCSVTYYQDPQVRRAADAGAEKKPGSGTEAERGSGSERSRHPTPLLACPESLWTKGPPSILEL